MFEIKIFNYFYKPCSLYYIDIFDTLWMFLENNKLNLIYNLKFQVLSRTFKFIISWELLYLYIYVNMLKTSLSYIYLFYY